MREVARRKTWLNQTTAARTLLLGLLMVAIAVPGNVAVEYPVQYVVPSAVQVTTSATV